MSISNIIATSHLSCSIDLVQVSDILKNATYRLSRIKALTYKFPSGGCCRVFANGKISVLGKKSTDSIVSSVVELSELLGGLGFPVNLQAIKIVNVVGTCSLERTINLDRFYVANKQIARYDPEIFPSVSLRLNGVTFLVFSSGKVTITGCSSIELFFQSIEAIKSHVSSLPLL